MRPDNEDLTERYYITDVFASEEDTPTDAGKKMDSRTRLFIPDAPCGSSSAHVNGKIIIKYVEEEVSYMADYEWNERSELERVRYYPVAVTAREKFLILRKQEGGLPDAP